MLNKPLMVKRKETNKVCTSSGEFLEYFSWRECKDLALGIGIHRKRFPATGYLVSKKVDEMVMLLKGKGSVIVKTKEGDQRFVLQKQSVVFIPKNHPFFFDPSPNMEILSATGPAWTPKQQTGLDYKRKDAGRMIL